MKINDPAPTIRVPALMGGNLTYLRTDDLHGRCVALCFLPPLGLLDCLMLERHSLKFHEQDSVLLGVVSEAFLLSGSWHRRLWPRGLILLSDPLGRLSRNYGITGLNASTRCHSFAIDSKGIVRYHLVHDLNEPGMKALLEITKAGEVPEFNCVEASEEENLSCALQDAEKPIMKG